MMETNCKNVEKGIRFEVAVLKEKISFLEETIDMHMGILSQQVLEMQDELRWLEIYSDGMEDASDESLFADESLIPDESSALNNVPNAYEDYDGFTNILNKVVSDRTGVYFQLQHSVEMCEEHILCPNAEPGTFDEIPLFDYRVLYHMYLEKSLEDVADYVIDRVMTYVKL